MDGLEGMTFKSQKMSRWVGIAKVKADEAGGDGKWSR